MKIHFSNLQDPDQTSFESAFSPLSDVWSSRKPEDLSFLIEVLAHIESAEKLSLREKSRRIQLCVAASGLTTNEYGILLKNFPRFNPDTRSAIRPCLPKELQPLVYRSASTEDEKKSLDDANQALVTALKESEAASARNSVEVGGEIPKSEKAKSGSEYRNVLLLGTYEKHESNRNFLNNHNFSSTRVDDIRKLEELKAEPFCGIVVDGSWWVSIDQKNHENEVKRILRFSSVAWLKLDQSGMDSAVCERLLMLCSQIRYKDPSIHELSCGGDSRLITSDLAALERSVSTITAFERSRFYPAEITQNEGRLLLAAASKRVRERHTEEIEIQRVETSMVGGGLSSAKVVLLRPDDGGAAFVAKMDSIERLSDEMDRFRRFIVSWETRLSPELHTHAGIGVILFGLIDDSGKSGAPAPTLYERLQTLSSVERGGKPKNPAEATRLSTGINRAFDKIRELNLRPHRQTGISNNCWIGLEPLEEMAKHGITYDLKVQGKSLDLLRLGTHAAEILKKLNGKATVHGDVHSKNILIRDDVDPFYIDYANSGPGHPCFDIVRLECSLLFGHLRVVADEERLLSCFTLINSGTAFEEIARQFPDLCASGGARLALQAAVTSREISVQVLREYGGTATDYEALKFIVCCQSLTLPEFQAAVVRSAIRAVAPTLLSTI